MSELAAVQIRGRLRWTDLAALVVSGVAAVIAPLQVFLFSFAILGPLHYLTEIAWLRKKQFYVRDGMVSSRAYVLLATAAVAVTLSSEVLRHDIWFWTVGVMLLVSLSVLVRNIYAILAIATAAIITAFFLKTWVFFIAVMVPTLVHVFFFTWTFMVSGALRDKRASLVKWVNPALMLVIPLALMFLPMRYAQPGGIWLRSEGLTFASIHTKLVRDLHHTMMLNSSLLNDAVVAGLLRVFAFVYLFHYLNWFTKTELLEWHKVSRRGWMGIGLIYIANISVYAVSLRAGFLVSTFLSLLHVLLEFPLNWQTLRFIAGENAVNPAKRWAKRRFGFGTEPA
jgi:hypothetical protein